jgi:hypothetical protein
MQLRAVKNIQPDQVAAGEGEVPSLRVETTDRSEYLSLVGVDWTMQMTMMVLCSFLLGR